MVGVEKFQMRLAAAEDSETNSTTSELGAKPEPVSVTTSPGE